MKSLKHYPVLLMAVVLTFAVSCKKEEEKEEEETPTAADTSAPTPTFSEGSGSLVAIKSQSTTQSPIGPIETSIGLAVASFYANGNTGSLLDAGTVTVNSKSLSKQANNSYTYTPGTTDVSGIDFGSNVEWSVGGASSVAAFSYTTTITFPKITAITSSETVEKTSGYTLSASGISGADSIIFQVGSVVKTLAGNSTACTFSSSELSGELAGTSIAQVAAYKWEDREHNSKTYYYVNETVVSKTITIK